MRIHYFTIYKNTMNNNQKKLADIWLLISALNCVRYAVIELEPDKMPSHAKGRYKNLKMQVENFLNSLQLKTEVAERKRLLDTNFENVGAMVETMALLAHVPLTHIEPFLERVNQLVFDLVKEVTNETNGTNGVNPILQTKSK